MIAEKGLEVVLLSISVSEKDVHNSTDVLTVEKLFGIGVLEMISKR